MCCERAKTAMEVIKSQGDHNLTRGELLMLFQKMIEDSEKMGNRMQNIEKKFESLENRVDTGFATITQQLIDLKKMVEKREPSLFEKVVLLKDAKMVWIFFIILLLVIGSILGVPTSGFNGILHIGE